MLSPSCFRSLYIMHHKEIRTALLSSCLREVIMSCMADYRLSSETAITDHNRVKLTVAGRTSPIFDCRRFTAAAQYKGL